MSGEDGARAAASMDAVTTAIEALACGEPDAATVALAVQVNASCEPDRELYALSCAAAMCVAAELRELAGACDDDSEHEPTWGINVVDGEIDAAPAEYAAAMRAITAACNRDAHMLADVLIAFYGVEGADGFARLLPSLLRLCASLRHDPPTVRGSGVL